VIEDLAQTAGENLNLCIARDGQTIVYELEAAPGNLDIYAVRKGKTPWPIADSEINEHMPRCSAALNMIYFVREPSEKDQELISAPVEGGSAQTLAASIKPFVYSMFPDQKGEHLYLAAFNHNHDPDVFTNTYDILDIPLWTAELYSLIKTKEKNELDVSVSPDDGLLVYSSRDLTAVDGGLRVFSLADQAEDLLTDDKAKDSLPLFSPDSKWVLFHRMEGIKDELTFSLRAKSIESSEEVFYTPPGGINLAWGGYDWYPPDGNAAGTSILPSKQ
jgi:hypothetical protein